MASFQPCAGLAQLVERQLPKLNVASSNLVPRSIFLTTAIGYWIAISSAVQIHTGRPGVSLSIVKATLGEFPARDRAGLVTGPILCTFPRWLQE